jgi:hypothetical protein
VPQSLQHIGVSICRGLFEKIAEVHVGVDAACAHECRGASEHGLFAGIAADRREQRELLQGLGKGSRGRGGVVGENPR